MEKNKTAKAFARTPMPIELRAKQFMPFAAVTGLETALREKEREREQSGEQHGVAEEETEL